MSNSESHDTGNCDRRESGRASTWRPWLATSVLVVYLTTLIVWDACALATARVSIWELQDSRHLRDWLVQLIRSGGIQGLRFIPVGFLTWTIVGGFNRNWGGGTHGQPRNWSVAAARGSVVLIAGLGLAAFVAATSERRLPALALLVLPIIGYLAGVWISWHWCRGWRVCGWLLVQGTLLIILMGLGSVTIFRLAIDDAPLAFEPSAVTSAEKKRVVSILRNGTFHNQPIYHWRLTENDVNFLLAWGMSLGSPDRKARVTITPERTDCQVSLGIPFPGRDKFLNIRVAGNGAVDDGQPWLRIERARVGRLAIPRPILWLTGPLLLDFVTRDPDAGAVMKSVKEVHSHQGALEVAARRGQFSARVVPSLLSRLGAKPDVRDATVDHLWHLAEDISQFPDGDASFQAFLQSAFRFAAIRSRDGDAVRENRAAIYALGILLGHRRVEQFVGPVTGPEFWEKIPRRTLPGIRGRADWTQHFWVSAAVASLSSEGASNAVGLLKEELDSQGGSGFSFGDLLADRAGTMFALAATRDETTARDIQRRITESFDWDDFFPPAADLPEGISADQLEKVYGGTTGRPYRDLVDEIERRLGTCRILNGSASVPTGTSKPDAL